ncbi:MAG: hypothetical protein ABFD98_17505 [Syntrophobacteraceae bacterium]
MSRFRQGKRSVAMGFLLAVLLVPMLHGTGGAQDLTWPKRFVSPEATVVLYQPQLETFKEDMLTVRSAVSVQKKGEKQPVFGVVWFSARVETDRDTRMATIDGVKTTNVKFADAKPGQEESLRAFLENEVKDWQYTLSLDRIVAAMDKVEEAMKGDLGLNTDPPRILFVTHPAVLVPLDGDPKLLPIPNSKLMRVANTAFLMIYDSADMSYYLRGGEEWLSATELKGPWKVAGKVPTELDALWKEIEKETSGKETRQVGPKKVESVEGKMPQIIVNTEPTELLATDGEPQYTPIHGTDLLYLSNTDSNVFLYSKTQEYIVLISGRWFKSKSLAEGPWTYVASKDLPPDFAKIPEGSVKGFVLVNIAGTLQAQEAVNEMYIPQTAAIDRKKATTTVSYDGDPKWESIPNTDLKYAVNTRQTVFKEETKYYAVEEGVWYEATSPNGPWKASVAPPQRVQDIPPSNPHYNAKYVKVYDYTDDTAYVGYTPGYTGSYVQNGTVVYGTGYRYAGYATPTTYVAYPATYGYSAVYDPYAATWGYQPAYYNPYAWLGAAITTAAVVGLTWAAWDNIWHHHHHYDRWYYGGGFWGVDGYRYRHVSYHHNTYVYKNWRPGRPGYRPPVWDRPGRPGWDRPGRPAHLPTGRPDDRPGWGAPERPNLYNRPWNRDKVAQRPARPGLGTGETRSSRPEVRQNNVFADKDGNVYRKTNKGWQQREGGKWAPATSQRPSGADTAARPGKRSQVSSKERPTRDFDIKGLDREFNRRQRGDVKASRAQRSNAAAGISRPAGGGRSKGESIGGGRAGGQRGARGGHGGSTRQGGR